MKNEAVAGAGLELKVVRLSDLTPYANNPRIIEDAIPLVMESIRRDNVQNVRWVGDDKGGHHQLSDISAGL